MINEINYIETANKPALFEYFIEFSEIVGINVVDYYKFILSKDGRVAEICGKVFIGETLKEAILRELKDNFGVEEILNYDYKLGRELVKNRFGEELNRMHVSVEINKNQIKKPYFRDLTGKWELFKKIYPKLSDEILNNPSKFRYFIELNIYYTKGCFDYHLKLVLNGDYEDWTKRRKNKYFPNAFDYSGEVFLGETLEDAVKRELKEKFGIEEIISWEIGLEVNDPNCIIPKMSTWVKIREDQIKDLNFKDFAKIVFNKVKIEIPRTTDYISMKSNLIKYHDTLFDKDMYKMEALEYLKYGGLLAGNRFDDIEEAEFFVKKLYKLGAEIVEVISIEEDEDKGIKLFGSASLDVKLPSDQEKRANILKIVNNECRREGLINKKLEEEKDTGQESTGFWWD